MIDQSGSLNAQREGHGLILDLMTICCISGYNAFTQLNCSYSPPYSFKKMNSKFHDCICFVAANPPDANQLLYFGL